MNLYNQIPYKGYNINIYYDDCPESPREWDNLGTFYTAHHRYKPEEQFASILSVTRCLSVRVFFRMIS